MLLDKDRITANLAPASYRAHIPVKPTEQEFTTLLDDFWLDAAYVAKGLARRELLPAKFGFSLLTLGHLRRLLEWRSAIGGDWESPVGRHGRGLQRLIPQDRWRRLEATFAGADLAGNWTALWIAVELHRELAVEIAGELGFRYPHEREAGVSAYLRSLSEAHR